MISLFYQIELTLVQFLVTFFLAFNTFFLEMVKILHCFK